MRDINLLPQELKPKGYAIKLSRSLRKIGVVFLVVFLIVSIFAAGSFAILSIRIRDSNNRQSKLKTEIRAQEQTEQKLILVQDRISKVTSILSSGDSREEVGVLKDVISILPPEMAITKVNLTDSKAEITVFATSSLYLTRFLAQVINSNYQNIELVSFSYRDALGGYEVELGIML